jgi:hypothetical protein
MRTSICFALAAVLVGGCTRYVVEKPVVERDTVIERPVVAATPAASPPRACSYAGSTYSHGSASCQSQTEFRCNDGTWSSTNVSC